MRWALVVMLACGCDTLLGIHDPHVAGDAGHKDGLSVEGMMGDGGGMIDGAIADAGGPADAFMACSAALPTFGSPVASSITGGTAMAIGDIDNDNDRDIVVAIQTDTVFLVNNGAGVFGANRKLRAGENVPADGVLVADVDNDNLGDVITWVVGDTFVTVHLRDPAMQDTFLAPISSTLPGGATIVSAVAGDFTEDGFTDLAVTTNTGVVVMFASTTNHGTFDVGPSFANGAALAIGDVDGDLQPDIVILQGSALFVAFGSGAGLFTPSATFGSGLDGNVAIGHYAAGNLSIAAGTTADNVELFLQPTKRTFVERSMPLFVGMSLPAAGQSSVMYAVDVNHDGHDDVAAIGNAVLQCSTAGSVAEVSHMPFTFGTLGTNGVQRLVDLNKDGKPDLVELKSSGVSVSLQQ